jgi:ribosomal protein S10
MLIKNKYYKICIYIKSFFYKYLFRDLKLLSIFLVNGRFFINRNKIIFLPLRVKKFSVVRSPFVSKLSKEQFEIRVYKAFCSISVNNFFFHNFFNFYKIKYSYYKLRYIYTH